MSAKNELDRLLTELMRRHVYKVAVIYVAVGFALLQGLDIVLPALSAPSWVLQVCVVAVLVGFPVALALGWVFDLTPSGVERTEDFPGEPPPALGRAKQFAGVAIALVLITSALAMTGYWLRPKPAEGLVVAGADVIAVLPFRATGPDVASLGEGMVDLLSTNLDQVGAIRTVPPRMVLRAWEEVDNTDVDRQAGLSIGRELGAGSVLTGSVTQAGAEARLAAELHTTTGDELARVTVSGPSDEVLDLVDSLSLQLLRDVWRSRAPLPSFDVSQITTSSLDAVRAYLRGEVAYRRSSWTTAVEEYEEALHFDSTFALAHVRLGSSYGWREHLGSPAAREHVAAALRFADRLPLRDRRLAVATALWYEDKRSDAVDSLEAYVGRFPDDADAWFLLGDIEYHRRDNFVIPAEHFYPPFERVLELDRTLTPALFHPIDLALLTADSARFQRYLGQMEAADGSVALVDLLRRAGDATWPPEGAVVTSQEMVALAELAFERRPGMFPALTGAAFYSMRGSPNEFVDGLLSLEDEFRANPQSAAMFSLSTAPLLSVLGRFSEAASSIEEANAIQPGLRPVLHVSAVAAGFAGTGDLPGAREVAGRETGSTEGTILLLAGGETGAARTMINGLPDDPGMRESLSGWASLIEGDTASGIAQLESGIAQVDSAGDLRVIRFEGLRYRLLDAQARRPDSRDEAVAALLSRRWGDMHYVTLRHLTVAEVAEESGDAATAADHYRRFLHILDRADPTAEPLISRARAGLARVGG